MANLIDSAAHTLDELLHLALEQRASDVHFESGENSFRVRFRIDGQLHVKASPALSLRDAIISRLKVQARMDIAEKRVPQDGRIQYRHGHHNIDLRVSSLPTVHGEKIVVRILKFNREHASLSDLGYESSQRLQLTNAIDRPHGLVLMTGPTGSGKTVSLYSCLELLNRPEINISTVEDPSEIHLPGANQVNIHPKAGLTFASTLRALLRQDPDVIMIGEIRDLETAEIAIQAAQTGHLVLSTLHTNDAPGTLARLRHMGIPAFNVAASVSLVTAQRLVRRLCEHCKQPMREADIQTLLRLSLKQSDLQTLNTHHNSSPNLYQAVGCHACDKGYKGRIGLYQVMPITNTLQNLILRDSDTQSLATQAAQEGVLTLRQAGWLKVWQGITCAKEIMAMTPHD
jgi:type IV pilus assembly protein PilB